MLDSSVRYTVDQMKHMPPRKGHYNSQTQPSSVHTLVTFPYGGNVDDDNDDSCDDDNDDSCDNVIDKKSLGTRGFSSFPLETTVRAV